MNLSSRQIKRGIPLVLVFGLAALLFFPLLASHDFLFDDVTFILTNPDLGKVKRFVDCFFFVLQPSKPVTNFFLAFGYWMAHGQVYGQHVLSLLLHLLTGLVWYANLLQWGRRTKTEVPQGFYLAVVFAFLTLPVLSEALEIGQFRGDILAALFASLSLLLTQYLAAGSFRGVRRFTYLGAIFLCLGLSQYSKEVFAVLLPPLLILFYGIPENRFDLKKTVRSFVAPLLAVEVIWASLLYKMLVRDGHDIHYTYRNTVGANAVPLVVQVRLASRAILESVLKFFSISSPTATPLVYRLDIGYSFPLVAHLAIVVLTLMMSLFLVSKKGWPRTWGAVAGAYWLYLIVPNANVGSEHYLYFASIGLMMLLALAVWKLLNRYARYPRALWWSVYGVFVFFSVIGLETRLFDCLDRISFTRAEVERAPDYYANWLLYEAALSEEGNTPAIQKEARRALDEAHSRGERWRGLATVDWDLAKGEMDYEKKYGTVEEAEGAFVSMMKWVTDRRDANFYEIQMAQYEMAHGECDTALLLMRRAKKMEDVSGATSPFEKALIDQIERSPERCKHLSKRNLELLLARTGQ